MTVLRAVQQERQAVTAFLRLPQDIFIPIMYLLTRSEKRPLTRLLALSQVCRRLRDVINDTPSLWSIISLSDRTFLLQRAISHSQQITLAFRIDERQLHLDDRRDFESHLNLVRTQRHRWYSMDFTLTALSFEAEKHVSPLFADPTPVLRRLSISRLSDWNVPRNYTCVPSEAPMLEQVTLDRLIIPWDSPVLGGLRSLRLRNIQNYPTHEQALDLLRRNTTLEDLEIQLSDVNARSWSTVASTDIIPIQLPTLRRLQLEGLSSKLAQEVVSAVHAPVCASFKLIMMNPPPLYLEVTPRVAFKDILEHTLKFLPRQTPSSKTSRNPGAVTLNLLIRTDQIKISLWLNGTRRKRPCYEVQCGGRLSSETAGWVKSALLPALQHPELALRFEPESWEDLEEVTQKFVLNLGPHIAILAFCNKGNIPWLLEMLSTVQDDSYLFPNLRHLSINSRCELPDILNMVKIPYGVGNVGSASLPAPLETLDPGPKGGRDQTIFDDGLRRIEEVIGNGAMLHKG